jgi:hypothetical protein
MKWQKIVLGGSHMDLTPELAFSLHAKKFVYLFFAVDVNKGAPSK